MLLFLCGDVMTGRGIDQILPHPSTPDLHERYMKSAIGYVRLAERLNGPIRRPVGFASIWGDALEELAKRTPHARIINLETSVTTSSEWEPKGINYRMHPRNVDCLKAAGIDCCVLANNHVLDWGVAGLIETLETLRQAGLSTAGAGNNDDEAEAPVIIPVSPMKRILVFALGIQSSGVPPHWAASKSRAGINYLDDLSDRSVERVRTQVIRYRRPGDLVVISIHWGGNWGYAVPEDQREFARALIDRCHVDLIHGHSSHHPKPFELYQDKLILYGCGDFISDYEGISGYESYRGDLVLMYFPELEAATGRLSSLELVPLKIKRMRLERASQDDAKWLCDLLNREGAEFGIQVGLEPDHRIRLR